MHCLLNLEGILITNLYQDVKRLISSVASANKYWLPHTGSPWSGWRLSNVQGPVSMSDKKSYRKISWSLEAARLVDWIIASLWNLTGTSAAVLPMCLSTFKAIGEFIQISRFRNITKSHDTTSYRILKRGPGYITVILHGHYGVSHHPQLDRFFNSLFRISFHYWESEVTFVNRTFAS